jgi:hypothetical protein
MPGEPKHTLLDAARLEDLAALPESDTPLAEEARAIPRGRPPKRGQRGKDQVEAD